VWAKQDFVVIGDGICANLFLYYLSKKNPKSSVLQISAPKVFPSCTLNSTATVSLNGIQAIEGTLGPLLVESFKKFESFFDQHQKMGIEKADHLVLPIDQEHFRTRFGESKAIDCLGQLKFSSALQGRKLDGYVIRPGELISKLQDIHRPCWSKFNVVEGLVVERIREDTVRLMTGEEIKGRHFIWATGAWRNVMDLKIFEEEKMVMSKVVPGSYLQWSEQDYGDCSFFCSAGHMNLVYRASDHKLMLGGTSDHFPQTAANLNSLHESYQLFDQHLPFDLPLFNCGKIFQGLREKGKQRRPFMTITENESSMDVQIGGVYRNGFTYPFVLADKLVESICND